MILDSLKKILQSGVSSLSSDKATASVVGIDIGSSSIKVVQLKKKSGKAILETYGSLALGPYATGEVGQVTNLPPDAIIVALTDVLREAGITAKHAAFAVLSSASLVFTLELPATIEEKAIAGVIPIEARKYIPVPINEVSLDWWAIPKREESFDESVDKLSDTPHELKTEVLVAAIHNEMLTRFKDISTKANLTPDFMEIETFSTVRGALFHELGAVAIIDIGAGKSKLIIVESGVVRSFHMINRGGHDITQAISKSLSITYTKAEEVKRQNGLEATGEEKDIVDISRTTVRYIFSEANAAILAYEKHHQKTVNKIILSGGGAALKGILTEAKGMFSVEVEMIHPFDKVSAPAFLAPVLAHAGPEFAVATGLALRTLQEL